MKRIATANRDIDRFGPGKDGFRAAVPGISDPTYLSAEFCNSLQEALVRVVEAAGLVPSDDYNQFLNAIGTLASSALTGQGGAAQVGYHDAPGRTVEQQLDMLYFGLANVVDKKFAGGADSSGVAASTAAITAAFASGKLFVVFPPGTYKKTGTITIPAGCEIVLNNASILQDDDLTAFTSNASDWKITGVGRIARAAGQPAVLVPSSVGILIGSAARRYSITGDISVYYFANRGFVADGGDVTTDGVARSNITGLTCRNNMNGFALLAGYAAEYVSFANCFALDNVTDGVYLEAGNLNWSGGAVTGNGVGWHLKHPSSGVNPHHGMVVGCHVNHNISYQLHAEAVAAGMDFVGCHFYDNANPATGRIRLENSRGVNITGGEIGCGIEGIYDGSHPHYGFNKVSGNYFVGNGTIITGVGYTREKLLVSGNFDLSGPSIFNDPRAVYALKRHSIDYAATETVNLASVGDEIYDNRGVLGANFVANPGGWYTTTVNLNLSFATAPTTEYIMFGRDDAASGTFTELHRVRVADCASGTTASVNASYDFSISGGGQLTAFLISPGGNNFTIKAGSMISFKSLS